YNTSGNITKFTDAQARQTTFDYAANGIDLLKVKQKATTTPNPHDELLAELGLYGPNPQHPQNPQHRPMQYTDASRRTYTLAWNAFGQLTSVVNPKNESTSLGYDGSGYLRSIHQPWTGGAKNTGFTYDTFGRVFTVTDSEAYTLTYSYDSLDRLIQTT